MSTNVVAFLLLNRFRDGCTLDKLVEAFDAMRIELETAKRDVAFCGETIDIINHAVSNENEKNVYDWIPFLTGSVQYYPYLYDSWIFNLILIFNETKNLL